MLTSTEDGQELRLARTMPDLLRDEELVRLNQRYGLCVLLGFALPAVVGGLATGSWEGTWRGLVWGAFTDFRWWQLDISGTPSGPRTPHPPPTHWVWRATLPME
jgi:hypothetical protein